VFLSGFLWIMTSCKDDDPEPLSPYTITITDIEGIPSEVVFDKVVAEIRGACSETIGSVEAPYTHGKAVLEVSSIFPPEKLQQVERTKENMCGHWGTASSDPDALVAKLGDFIAYNGDVKVGRIYLTDWSGKGSTKGKTYIYYHYTDRSYTLSGENINLHGSSMFKPSYEYSAQFKMGWNIYAYINPPNTANNKTLILCTTTIPEDTQLHWQFESWVY